MTNRDMKLFRLAAKLRHITHQHLDNCNYGVTTAFWDFVFHTNDTNYFRGLLPR